MMTFHNNDSARAALTTAVAVCAVMLAASNRVSAADADGIVSKAPPPPAAQMWDGLYAGVSFGPSWLRAQTSILTHSVNTSTTTFDGLAQVSTATTDSAAKSSGSNWGAQSDISLGYNFRLGGNLVTGLQVEGTIANSQVQLNGSQISLANTASGTVPPSTTT